MAIRGKRGGPNRSEGMATRPAVSYCKAEVTTAAVRLRCFRKEGHRGPHWDLTDGKRLEWRGVLVRENLRLRSHDLGNDVVEDGQRRGDLIARGLLAPGIGGTK